MIVSSLAEEGAEETVAALALGAADTLPKPGTGRFNGRFSEILVGKLKALGYADAHSSIAPARASGVQAPLRAMPSDPIEVLAIGASTGGIHAIGVLFQTLPKRIGVPILITQHLPVPFMPVFARQLRAVTHREVLVAEDGMPLLPDRVLLGRSPRGLPHARAELERMHAVGRSDVRFDRRGLWAGRARRGPDRHGP